MTKELVTVTCELMLQVTSVNKFIQGVDLRSCVNKFSRIDSEKERSVITTFSTLVSKILNIFFFSNYSKFDFDFCLIF